jgi:hypothetical protein
LDFLFRLVRATFGSLSFGLFVKKMRSGTSLAGFFDDIFFGVNDAMDVIL